MNVADKDPVFAVEVPVFSLSFSPMSGVWPDEEAAMVMAAVPVTVELLTEVAVMVTVPEATPVTNPVALTVASTLLLLVHVTAGLVAFAGVLVVANCTVVVVPRVTP